MPNFYSLSPISKRSGLTNAFATVNDVADWTTTNSAAYEDITNFTVSITPTRNATIYVFFYAHLKNNTTIGGRNTAIKIIGNNGVGDTDVITCISNTVDGTNNQYRQVCVSGSGVYAGAVGGTTYTFRGAAKVSTAGDTGTFSGTATSVSNGITVIAVYD